MFLFDLIFLFNTLLYRYLFTLLGSREYPMAFKPGDERLTDE
jgi:hypothetical protein